MDEIAVSTTTIDLESTGKITELNNQSTEADVFIRSSDGLLFKVPSYRLMAASPVFQSMFNVARVDSENKIKACTDKIITFTDDKIETAQVISTFLNIIHQGTLPEPSVVDQLWDLEDVVSFMKEYDTAVACYAIHYMLHSWVRDSKLNPFAFFRLACMLDDVLLAKLAIKRTGNWHWPDKYQDKIGEGSCSFRTQYVTLASVMDPTGLSLERLQWLPSDYLFALLRASRVRHDKGNAVDSGTWNAVADEFWRVMQKIRETPS